MLGKILVDNIDRKKKVVFDQLERKIDPDELHFSSSRGGAIPGTHMILFDSAADTIEIKHTARGREDFAAGAIMAAEFIQAKTGFYTIDDLMEGIIGGVTQHWIVVGDAIVPPAVKFVEMVVFNVWAGRKC